MKHLFIVANWKANKTEDEAKLWLTEIKEFFKQHPGLVEIKEVVICPPFNLLYLVSETIRKKEIPIQVGSQDISQFGKGAYTGEVPASLLAGYVRYCIIGHSERRINFHENDEMLSKKVSMALGGRFLPIFCIQNKDTFIPEGVKIVAYEPVAAIGTGNPDTPENAEKVAKAVKEKGVQFILYGGSVNAQNVSSFTSMESIDGVLVGNASLDALEFAKIIQNA